MTSDYERPVSPGEVFVGQLVSLRLVTLADCTDTYVSWLEDPEVNQYLETRWARQTLDSVRGFASAMIADRVNYLFAIVENSTARHIGNIKVGPINFHHGFADLSYFIGEKSCWGRGYAEDAIRIAVRVAFDRIGVRLLQAGLYEGNSRSARVLEKAGFSLVARFPKQLQGPEGFEDHLWYVRFADDTDAI